MFESDRDDDRFGDESGPEHPQRSLLDSRWMWVVLGIVGLVAFELGVPPWVAAVVFCLKLGFSHLANGLWLWRRDSRRGNGVIIGLAYVALAGWRVVLWSFLLSAMFSYVSAMVEVAQRGAGNQRGAGGNDIQILSALGLTFGAALTLTSILSAALCVAAGVLRTPLWLSKRVTDWRLANTYPPNPIGNNSASSLVNYSLLVICLVLMVAFMSAMFALGPAGVPGIFLGVIGIPVFTLVMRDWLDKRIVARTPADCWEFAADDVEEWDDDEDGRDDDSDDEEVPEGPAPPQPFAPNKPRDWRSWPPPA